MVSPIEPVKWPSTVVPPKDSLLADILPPNSSSVIWCCSSDVNGTCKGVLAKQDTLRVLLELRLAGRQKGQSGFGETFRSGRHQHRRRLIVQTIGLHQHRYHA